MLRHHFKKWRFVPAILPISVLMPEGDWATHTRPLPAPFNERLPVSVCEVVGPTPEAIADEIQALRDKAAPDREDWTTSLWGRTIYSTLDRQLALAFTMMVGPRSDFIGPLPLVRDVILRGIRRNLGL